jgi:hypothetical protein
VQAVERFKQAGRGAEKGVLLWGLVKLYYIDFLLYTINNYIIHGQLIRAMYGGMYLERIGLHIEMPYDLFDKYDIQVSQLLIVLHFISQMNPLKVSK